MGFVIFPTILKMFGSGAYRIVGPLFFFNVFIAGITGVFSIIEACAGNIEIEFGTTRRRAVTIATCIMTFLATIFCFGNGQYIIGAIDPMVAGFNMLISGISQIIVFMWMNKALDNHPIWFSVSGQRTYFYYAVKYIIPLILGFVFISSLFEEIQAGFGWASALRWSWFIGAVLLAMVFSRLLKNGKTREIVR
jgi:NSS family neurotransmitter:Na+ symporter